ncbi:hypothetical protein EVAR_68249_1 [Eumeta japonica]|uniref:Uncharacterized protein n=1 Tax=Eumeta variegata TaxID=151549 RepID=A0A4C1TI77_EUMVA|nr:hypothetical protein EVAR_68249_1 [Eumeta japonica]
MFGGMLVGTTRSLLYKPPRCSCIKLHYGSWWSFSRGTDMALGLFAKSTTEDVWRVRNKYHYDNFTHFQPLLWSFGLASFLPSSFQRPGIPNKWLEADKCIIT